MTTTDAIRIEPTVDVADIELDSALGDEIAAFYGVEAVRTVEDWLDAIEAGTTGAGTLTADDLCTTDESPHVLETDGRTQAYQCVIDPMIVPFLTDEPATVRSTCPITGAEVDFEIADGDVHVRQEGAFFSLGIDPDATGSPLHESDETYRTFCPYGNVFASRDAYEQWADETDAITMRLPLEYGVAVVGGIARRLAGSKTN